jgi:hypothetical protein
MKLLLQKKSSAVFTGQSHLPADLVCRPESPPMRRRLPVKLWVEFALGLASSALLALAIFSPHWMEQFFGLAPDAGDGSAEYGFALVWATVSLLMFGLARHTWRKQIQTSSVRLAAER